MSKFLSSLIFLILSSGSILYADVSGAFDIEGRSGNPNSSSWQNWELAILDPNVGSPQNSSHWSWQSGVLVPWQLTYNSNGGTLVWIWDIGGPNQLTIYGSALNYPFNSVKVYVETTNQQVTAGDSVRVTDLVLQSGSGTQTGTNLLAQGPGSYSEFVFGTPISGSFTLTGKSSLTWDAGQFPGDSNMLFHITEATAVPAPEPSTYLILAGFLAVGFYMQRRKKAVS